MGKKKKKKKKENSQTASTADFGWRSELFGPPLLRPMSPFERRMADLNEDLNLDVGSLDVLEKANIRRLMQMDVAFQIQVKQLQRRIPAFCLAQMKGGSGLQLSNLLRWYFQEYFHRLNTHGPDSLPTSFNVVEAFMSFNREYRVFQLRTEIEHLLSINDYFRWYDSDDMPKDPAILADVMKEATIYSYEMVSEAGSLRIAGDSQQVFAGISMVRHDYELSCLLLAGEKPSLYSDEAILSKKFMVPAPGRESIGPAPDLGIKDRYLEGYVDFAKIIIMTRFDLRARKYDVRYVNVDNGNSFNVLTDDTSIFGQTPTSTLKVLQQAALKGLKRYDAVFSAVASMIYLPAYFASRPQEVHELRLTTELQAMKNDKQQPETIREMRASEFVAHRDIRCLSAGDEALNDQMDRLIEPPELTFKSDGYWKPIGPLEIGTDKNGAPIAGRTWVSRHESWSAQSPQTFLLKRKPKQSEGPDPGVIYIQRSPGHEVNLYKVGLTRRNVQLRAQELSSATSVPLPFGVLASWEVGDCGAVEREVHQRLAFCRINPRREFFLAELSLISRTIEAVIRELSQHTQ